MCSNRRYFGVLRNHYIATVKEVLPELEAKIQSIGDLITRLKELDSINPPAFGYYPSTHVIINSFDHQKVYELFAFRSFIKKEDKRVVIKIQRNIIFYSEFDISIATKYKEMNEGISRLNDEWNAGLAVFHDEKANLIESGQNISEDNLKMEINQKYTDWMNNKEVSLNSKLQFFNNLHDFIYPHYSDGTRPDILPLMKSLQKMIITGLHYNSWKSEYISLFESTQITLRGSVKKLSHHLTILEGTRLKPWYSMPFT